MAIDRENSPYRRGMRFDRSPIPMVEEDCIPIDAGTVTLVVESRRLTNAIIDDTYGEDLNPGIEFDDFGATLHVCGAADGFEYLRFDCFENEPHYHYIHHPDGGNTVVRIDEVAVGDPLEFSLACVERQLADMLRYCGAGSLADAVAAEPERVEAAMAEVRALMEKARLPVG
ncbi:MAG: hypothetical protein AMXMBFR46_24980 [Acidimicrobiia bacterium]